MFQGGPSNREEPLEHVAEKRAYEDSSPPLSSYLYPERVRIYQEQQGEFCTEIRADCVDGSNTNQNLELSSNSTLVKGMSLVLKLFQPRIVVFQDLHRHLLKPSRRTEYARSLYVIK